MEVTVEGKKFHCQPGDRFIIDGNIQQGCGFFWSEKL
jgi:hypothetical protein